MSYSGNPSLAQDVQERISNTFQQTLELISQQRDQEALVGCEFILRMDPQFQPAQTLVDRLKGDARPIEIDDLRAAPAAPSLDDLPQLDDLEDLDGLEDLGPLDDLEDISFDPSPVDPSPEVAPAMPPAAPAAPAAPVPETGTSGLRTVLGDLFAKRNFNQILQIATTQKQALEADPEAKQLVEQAQSLLESETYVEAFLSSARQAREAGQIEEMQKHLEKARTLDPGHPEVLGFATQEPAGEPLSDTVPSFAAPSPTAPSPTAPSLTAPSFTEPSFTVEEPAADDDSDLLALQQQSLSLETEEAEALDDPFAGIAQDPRQTKPMEAVPLEDEAPAAEAVFDDFGSSDLEADLSFDDSSEDLGSDLQDLDTELALEGEDNFDGADDISFAGGGEEEDPESGDRVGQLLQEGQQAFDEGQFQAAIDVWSRIFLIDIDNTEASSRIEEARSRKAEIERQAEELFHTATGHLEAEALDEAKATLQQVLELQPSHSMAREYLGQLESGQVPVVSAAGELELGGDLELGEDGDLLSDGGGSSPSLEAAVERDRVAVVKKTDMRIVAVGAVVLLAAIALVAFLMVKWDDLFPNQELPPPTAQARKVDPIERATKMHEGGNTENAILMLERIQDQDPIYEDAQALIAQWKALVEAPEPVDTGPSEEQQERFALLVDAARQAHGQNRFIRARKYFERATKIMPLAAEDQALKQDGDFRLESLEEQIRLFGDGQFAAIIPDLWRKREGEPENLDIERLLVDSYYNLALSDLQRGNAQGAAQKLREALEIQPDNQELQRMRLFAQTYVQRPQDLLYRIFVKYLPSR